MQITKDHIDQLYSFTEKHFVEWYDLQTELVDHLANDIEQIWREHPKLSFKEARTLSFKKFGVIGFSDVVEKRQNALYKKYWLLMWKFFTEYFKVPKIILTLLLISTFFQLLKNIDYRNILILSYLAILTIYIFVFVFITFKKIKRKEKETHKKWLFERIVASVGGFGFMAQIPFQSYQILSDNVQLNYWTIWLTSTFLVFLGIVIYISTQIIPKKMTDYLTKSYPEYQAFV